MKDEDFIEMLRIQKEWEFSFRGRIFTVTYGKDQKGNYILFGEQFLGKKFYSYGELMNEAYIDNTLFKEILPDL